MEKWFVLTTKTALSKREVTLTFDSDNTVIIPMCVLDEIEKISNKQQYDERGRTAKNLIKYLSAFSYAELLEGVVQENNSILRVVKNYNEEEIPKEVKEAGMGLSRLQERVLQTCLGLKKEAEDKAEVILVSKSPFLRWKAELANIHAQTFKYELLPEIDDQYSGRVEIEVPKSIIDTFFDKKKVSVHDVLMMNEEFQGTFYNNMFVTMKCGSSSALGRVEEHNIVPLTYGECRPYGVKPLNVGQKFMIEALMTDHEKAPLVIIKGPAGTAKTFMALAVGMQKVVEEGEFTNKILVSRSPTETGEKLGFLPGDEIDKLGPYLRGIMDNLKMLHSGMDYSEKSRKRAEKKSRDQFEKPLAEDGSYFFDGGIIKIEAVGFIRGRSICDTYIIIDEAQNLTPVEMKTILTRVGTGTKLVIIGDPAQIDRPDLNERNNGLSYASERMKGEHTCWQITLEEGESVRSELARRASILL